MKVFKTSFYIIQSNGKLSFNHTLHFCGFKILQTVAKCFISLGKENKFSTSSYIFLFITDHFIWFHIFPTYLPNSRHLYPPYICTGFLLTLTLLLAHLFHPMHFRDQPQSSAHGWHAVHCCWETQSSIPAQQQCLLSMSSGQTLSPHCKQNIPALYHPRRRHHVLTGQIEEPEVQTDW